MAAASRLYLATGAQRVPLLYPAADRAATPASSRSRAAGCSESTPAVFEARRYQSGEGTMLVDLDRSCQSVAPPLISASPLLPVHHERAQVREIPHVKRARLLTAHLVTGRMRGESLSASSNVRSCTNIFSGPKLNVAIRDARLLWPTAAS